MKLFYMALLAALLCLGWVITTIVAYQSLIDSGHSQVASAIGCSTIAIAGSIGLIITTIMSIDKEEHK